MSRPEARKTFPLRLSPELYDELRRWAEAELRSVNGQIEFILRQAVRERRRAREGPAGGEPEEPTGPQGPDGPAGPAAPLDPG